MSQKHVFVVEDDDVLAALLTAFLVREGFSVTRFDDGQNLLADVARLCPDAVILDGRLPSVDGFDLCRELRPLFHGAIMMLTARDEDIDELLALELGADDYIRKPAPLRIILAHLKACLRRVSAPSPTDHETSTERLTFGELDIDRTTRSVYLRKAELTFTTAEFDLLWLLACRAGEVLTREEIFQSTRGLTYDGFDRSIDMRISRLRKLIGDDADPPQIIKTVRGKGYLFVGARD